MNNPHKIVSEGFYCPVTDTCFTADEFRGTVKVTPTLCPACLEVHCTESATNHSLSEGKALHGD